MNVTLKDFPDELHATLKEIAEQSGRSLNRQIIHALEGAIRPRRTNEKILLQRIKAHREHAELHLDEAFLQEAISEGRS